MIKLSDEQEVAVHTAVTTSEDLFISGGAGCYPEDTEFMTEYGWKKISDYKVGDKVLQSDSNMNTSFVVPQKYIIEDVDRFINIKNKKVDFTTSYNHKHLVRSLSGKQTTMLTHQLQKKHIQNKKGTGVVLYNAFKSPDRCGIDYSDSYMRLKIAVLADGSFSSTNSNSNRVVVNIKKKRKIDRLTSLLRKNNIEYRVSIKSTGFHVFSFVMDNREKVYNDYWYNADIRQLKIITEECLLWDGTSIPRKDRNVSSVGFFSSNKCDADFIQYAFSATGHRAVIFDYDRVGSSHHKSIEYSVRISQVQDTSGISKNKKNCGSTTEFNVVDAGMKMYCFTVDSGFFVVRQKGRIYVSGNCGKSAVIKEIVYRLNENNEYVAVTATTNEASDVLSKMGLWDARTLYKASALDLYLHTVKSREPTIQDYCVVIVDECSMLSDSLILAVRAKFKGIRFIFVGDANQLVVKKMFDYSKVNTVTLTKNFRSANEEIASLVNELKLSVIEKRFPAIENSHNIVNTQDWFEFVNMAKMTKSKLLCYTNTIIDKYRDAGCDAISVHKSQGKSYDTVFIDLTNIFSEYKNRNNPHRNGLTLEQMLKLIYVGISRTRERIVIFTGSSRSWSKL